MRRLGGAARSPGRIYLVGGSSAVLVGWRETTVDVDLKQDSADVRAMGSRGLVRAARILEFFEVIESELIRYPALDPASFREKVLRAAEEMDQ